MSMLSALLETRRATTASWPAPCLCVFCGAAGTGPTGWTRVCPTCAASPTRQARYVELTALRNLMQLEALGRGLSASHRVVTPEIRHRLDALS